MIKEREDAILALKRQLTARAASAAPSGEGGGGGGATSERDG